MNIFETIAAQAAAMRLPLYAVTATRVARRGDAALLSMHWHGFLRQTPLKLPGVVLPLRSVAQSVAQLDLSGEGPGELEHALLEAAWQFGAWELERVERPGWWRLGVPATEVRDAMCAFGFIEDEEDAQAHTIADAPDRREMLREAGRRGYVRWLFRPRKYGIWSMVREDADETLDSSGGRTLPCPVLPRAVGGTAGGAGGARTVYRLGHSSRLVLGRG